MHAPSKISCLGCTSQCSLNMSREPDGQPPGWLLSAVGWIYGVPLCALLASVWVLEYSVRVTALGELLIILGVVATSMAAASGIARIVGLGQHTSRIGS